MIDDHAEAFDQAAEHGVEHEQRGEELQPRQMQADDEFRCTFSPTPAKLIA